jgi:hypothetical protein
MLPQPAPLSQCLAAWRDLRPKGLDVSLSDLHRLPQLLQTRPLLALHFMHSLVEWRHPLLSVSSSAVVCYGREGTVGETDLVHFGGQPVLVSPALLCVVVQAFRRVSATAAAYIRGDMVTTNSRASSSVSDVSLSADDAFRLFAELWPKSALQLLHLFEFQAHLLAGSDRLAVLTLHRVDARLHLATTTSPTTVAVTVAVITTTVIVIVTIIFVIVAVAMTATTAAADVLVCWQ